jgi:hypothetical protein
VGLCDWVIRVIWHLGASEHVSPFHTDLVAGFDIEHLCGNGTVVAAVAGEVCVVDVLNGVIAVRNSDAYCLALVGAVDATLLLESPLQSSDGKACRTF